MFISKGLVFISLFVMVVRAEETCKNKIKASLHYCKVTLPQHETHQQCIMERKMSTQLAKAYYELTNPHPSDEIASPSLNQPVEVVGLVARLDDLDSSWFSIYYTMITALNLTSNGLRQLALHNKMKLTTLQDYKVLYNQFHTTLTKNLGGASKWFRQPIDNSNFLDITINDTWREDKYFAQRRLAGQCAYHLRQVNDGFNESNPIGIASAHLLKQFNMDYKWDTQLSSILKKKTTLTKVISKGKLYVVYHEIYNNLPRTDDISTSTPNDKHNKSDLLYSPSPIAVFVLNDVGELEVVAIQLNYTPYSEVIAPNPNNPYDIKWMRAKGFVEIADMAVCQLNGHLVSSHQTQEILCNLFRRSFSLRHPLSQLMTIHCQGTIPVGHLGISSLVDEYRYMHKLFDFGHLGAKILIKNIYKNQDYTDSDLPMQLESRGLDNKKLKYYPYRDDGLLIWKQIKKFAEKYVDLYYKKDTDVIEDGELQIFANEVSVNGNYSHGGKYKGFPSTFKTKSAVSVFLTRFIWLVIQHASNSYPLLPYGAYLPIMPTKLYKDETTDSYAQILPDLDVALNQEVLTFTLSGFRMNRLFTYSKHMEDSKAGALVEKTKNSLHTCIQDELEQRNKERFEKRQLTYQYMEPKYLPNSIHS